MTCLKNVVLIITVSNLLDNLKIHTMGFFLHPHSATEGSFALKTKLDFTW